MRALAHLAGQGDRTVHGARLVSRRLPADPPHPPDPPRPGRGRPAPGPAGDGPGQLLAGALFTPERAGYTPPHTRTAPPGRRGRSRFLRELSDGGLREVPP